MPNATLALNITDLLGEPPRDEVLISFRSGSTQVEARFPALTETSFVVEGIPCRGGAGQLFEVSVTSRRYRGYRFFQMLREGYGNTPGDNAIRLAVNPGKVHSIEAPAYPNLPEIPARLLAEAAMTAPKTEDRPWAGLRGAALYDALTPKLKACLLNLCAKAAHASAQGCAAFLQSLLVARQDRCYMAVDAAFPEFLRQSPRFKSAPGALHEPLPGYVLEDSFKSRDAHANLQVTFMRHRVSGQRAADIDIDEASGIEHGFEVLRNRATGGRTNPFQVRELLLLAAGEEDAIRPGYRFVF